MIGNWYNKFDKNLSFRRQGKNMIRTFKIRKAFVLLLIISGLLSSCTTKIASRPPDETVPAMGIAYHLPATELSYIMTFRLKDSAGTIAITDSAIEHKIVPDRAGGTYLIDSAAMASISKTIPLAKITINNGMLSSISYDAKDSTADIVKSGVSLLTDAASGGLTAKLSSLGNIAMLLAGSRSFQSSGTKKAGESSSVLMCNRETRDALDEYDFLQRHLADMKRRLYAAEVQLTEKRDGMAEKIQDIESIIKKTGERLSELDKHLTIQYRMPLAIEPARCESFGNLTLESAPFTKWFGTTGDNEIFQRQLREWLEENKLSYTISNCSPQRKTQDNKAAKVDALYYRIPAQCKLEITKDHFVSTNYIEIMQCGRLAAVEIVNGAFQNNSHRIEFDPASGEIKSFEFKDNTVRAAEAIGSASEIVKKTGQ